MYYTRIINFRTGRTTTWYFASRHIADLTFNLACKHIAGKITTGRCGRFGCLYIDREIQTAVPYIKAFGAKEFKHV